MSKKIGVLLSGCGVKDGSEIHETVSTLIALDRAGARAFCVAPGKAQDGVVDHFSGKPADEKRCVLAESARIARGHIKALEDVDPADLDGLVIPGGFGAAKNLCTFATEGADCAVDGEVESLLRAIQGAGKPIGALCIAPVILARVFGPDLHPELTIGSDSGTAEKLEAMGARHVKCGATDVCVDRRNKMVTTPCYMLAGSIKEVAEGAEKLVEELLRL